jgi:small subunit ribosomal protein S13
MARIAGVNLPVQKHVWVGLQSIYGIGRTRSKKVCEAAGVTPSPRSATCPSPRSSACAPRSASTWSRATCAARSACRIKRLMDLGCYRGLRHRRGLPLRGQRTRTNARTRKGPRKAIKK